MICVPFSPITHRPWRQADAPLFAGPTRDDWSTRLIVAGVISAPVLSQFEIVSDPALRDVGRFRSVEDSEGELCWVPELPYVVSSWTTKRPGPSPGLGEHKEEVLRDAGLTDYEIHEFGIAGAFGVEVVAGW